MPDAPRRILLIKPSSLGDVVHALPVLAGLRDAYPDAHIAWLIARSCAPLLEGHPLLDELIPFDRKRYGQMWWNPRANLAFWRFARDLRRRRFDLVIDLQGLIRSGLLAWFSGAPRRAGFASAREGAWLFYSLRVHCPASLQHAVERNLYLARALGIEIGEPRFPLAGSQADLEAGRALLERAAASPLPVFTAVLPAARWKTKIWPAAQVAALIDAVHAERMPRCVLLGAPDERPLAEQIVAGCESDVVDLTGQTSLRQLAAILALSDRVICCDSGPMHIAAALGKPIVAIFGPTSAARTGPFADTARVVTHPVGCAPCYRRKCPLAHHDCLRKLEPAAVLARVRESKPNPAPTGG